MKAILNELSKTNTIILFIDEIHTIVGAGSAEGTLDASNMFKPALSRGDEQSLPAQLCFDVPPSSLTPPA